MKNEIDKFINFAEVSRALTGTRSVVTKNRMPKKHIKAVDELRYCISEWLKKYQK